MLHVEVKDWADEMTSKFWAVSNIANSIVLIVLMAKRIILSIGNFQVPNAGVIKISYNSRLLVVLLFLLNFFSLQLLSKCLFVSFFCGTHVVFHDMCVVTGIFVIPLLPIIRFLLPRKRSNFTSRETLFREFWIVGSIRFETLWNVHFLAFSFFFFLVLRRSKCSFRLPKLHTICGRVPRSVLAEFSGFFFRMKRFFADSSLFVLSGDPALTYRRAATSWDNRKLRFCNRPSGLDHRFWLLLESIGNLGTSEMYYVFNICHWSSFHFERGR